MTGYATNGRTTASATCDATSRVLMPERQNATATMVDGTRLLNGILEKIPLDTIWPESVAVTLAVFPEHTNAKEKSNAARCQEFA
ncbi:hypothetical protein PAXRUDRAFT_822379 [Paxillus rubicundulus Ve08.2h10]|uniref:Unplaced genomic scaffold scaffold_28, whole genome shotgun sequence n=1 Tax=Paxillus rubicundulus Ve08.2h10 TaxID=930991 RepID=A0A0D0E592_9AGAM|nr:hypothetical protein PAXRUDRAFT_822379 [Paxillus rubicundulus Ve08.2h10]